LRRLDLETLDESRRPAIAPSRRRQLLHHRVRIGGLAVVDDAIAVTVLVIAANILGLTYLAVSLVGDAVVPIRRVFEEWWLSSSRPDRGDRSNGDDDAVVVARLPGCSSVEDRMHFLAMAGAEPSPGGFAPRGTPLRLSWTVIFAQTAREARAPDRLCERGAPSFAAPAS